MLNRRTNLLLSEDEYRMLFSLAKEKKTSMGDLIRHAVRKVYNEDSIRRRKKIFAEIKRLRKQVNTKNIDILELVREGRK